MHFIRFFVGTPRRFLATFIGVAVLMVIEHFAPGAIAGTFGRLLRSVGQSVFSSVINLVNCYLGPLAQSLLPLILVGIGFRIMLRGFGFGGGRRRR